MKVIFLDIDGVLSTKASCRAAWPEQVVSNAEEAKKVAAATLDPALVVRLQHVCETTGAVVVIVSGWRTYMTLAEIKGALRSAGLVAPVVGMIGPDARIHEVSRWCRLRPEITHSVVIDDTKAHWVGYQGALVVPVDGITEGDAKSVIELFTTP